MVRDGLHRTAPPKRKIIKHKPNSFVREIWTEMERAIDKTPDTSLFFLLV